MVLLDSKIIELELALIGVTATIIFGYASKRDSYLSNWLYVVILSTLGLTSNYLRNFIEVFEYLSYILYALAILLVTFIVLKEYYRLFFKKVNQIPINGVIFFESILIFSSIITGFFLLLIDLILQIRITLRKKSITNGFLSLSLFGATLTILGNIFINLGFEEALAINVGADLFFTSMLITTGIVSLLEGRILKSEMKYKESYERAKFYKDLVAHDINNVLQNIRTSSDLMSLEIENSNKIKEFREMINEQVDRGANLVKNVRTISELEASEISLYPIDLLESLRSSVDFIKNSYKKQKLNVDINTDFPEIYIEGNDLLVEAFENILNNAVKHNENNEINIEIIITKQDINSKGYYQIEIKDNAKGIPDDLKEQIFLRSYRKDKSISGMGLGLSLVKKIIESYGGKIWVRNKVQGDYRKGSNFVLLLPASL